MEVSASLVAVLAAPDVLSTSPNEGVAMGPLPQPAAQCPYLLKRFSMIAFSVHKSSAGKELACQRRRSSALERYSVLAMSVRN